MFGMILREMIYCYESNYMFKINNRINSILSEVSLLNKKCFNCKKGKLISTNEQSTDLKCNICGSKVEVKHSWKNYDNMIEVTGGIVQGVVLFLRKTEKKHINYLIFFGKNGIYKVSSKYLTYKNANNKNKQLFEIIKKKQEKSEKLLEPTEIEINEGRDFLKTLMSFDIKKAKQIKVKKINCDLLDLIGEILLKISDCLPYQETNDTYNQMDINRQILDIKRGYTKFNRYLDDNTESIKSRVDSEYMGGAAGLRKSRVDSEYMGGAAGLRKSRVDSEYMEDTRMRKPCYFFKKGICKKGKNCPFLHQECSFFKTRGGCKRGEECGFLH